MSLYRNLICVIFTLYLFHTAWPSCVFHDGKYDLSPLDRPKPWIVPTADGKEHFEINLCHAVNNATSPSSIQCPNSSVCRITSNQTISYGDSIENKVSYAIADNTGGGFTLYLVTKGLCNYSGTVQGIHRATIYFACGPNLGVPELIMRSDCQVNFYWVTYAACPDKPKKNQVPCYVIDEKGQKKDLSHLIKNEGFYAVNTLNPAIDFEINVCSNVPHTNNSAIRKIGSESLSFGTLQDGLQKTSEGLLLTYKTEEVYSQLPPGCSLKPKTSILFKCPSRGLSQPPKVISDFNCQYEILWQTEYACPESLLKGDFKKCQFTTEKQGVEIDLSPLKKSSYKVQGSINGSEANFNISVCKGLDHPKCGGANWNLISVCLNDSVTAGTTNGPKFIYADDEILLVYSQGAPCRKAERQTTTIAFKCNITASDGNPLHVYSDECNHFFEWQTKHACLKQPLDTNCSVTVDNKKVINLQKLLLIDGAAWIAEDKRSSIKDEKAEYYLNVCGGVSHLANLSLCGGSSSACVLTNGSYINLGNFVSVPIYDKTLETVRLEYSGGSPCRDKTWSSSIDFFCKPGLIDSEPALVRIDEADCLYRFEWHTAEACPEGSIEGSDCKVQNENLGISFDLSPLKSKTFRVNTLQYDYYLGVCEGITDSPCSKRGNLTEPVGVCQEDVKSHTAWVTGRANSSLSYMDGVINLTYMSGDPYDNQNKTSRMTIIIFICDVKKGQGAPMFFEEMNFAYVFHWYTALVCPRPTPSECTVRDPMSHMVYDLSVLSQNGDNWHTIETDSDKKESTFYINVCQPLHRPNPCDSDAAVCMVSSSPSGEKTVFPNLGRITSPPIIDTPGHLTLTYSNGTPCTSYGRNTTYSTVIYFLCADRLTKRGPSFLNKLGACEYSFLWITEAACPVGTTTSADSCELTDIDTGFVFDLTPLMKTKKPYSVYTPTRNFQFNVCGRVVEGCVMKNETSLQPSKNIGVCEIDNEGSKISDIVSSFQHMLTYSPGQDLTLTYHAASDSEKDVVIKFPCDKSLHEPVPKYLGFVGNQHIFEMKTHLTCVSTSFDCTVVDKKGNEYDLTPLARNDGTNYEIEGTSENIYHISFCHPLNKVSEYKCPGGTSGACQTSSKVAYRGLDLGSQESIQVSDKGTIVIRYTNGSICHNPPFRSSTTINLFCSSTEGRLTFVGATTDCEYVFSFDTPAACPVNSSQGNNCMVKDPHFGYMFDLNPLKIKSNNYNVTVGEYQYSFNVCDKLNGYKHACMNSSACQTKPSDVTFSRSLGHPSDVLKYKKGVITLEYKSGSGTCHGKYERSTLITFTCHHALEDKDGPFFISEAEDCTYLFEWPTVHACPPFDVIDCSVIDKNGTEYDLSTLSLPSDNYYVKNPLFASQTFVINLCRSIVHTPDSHCPYTSAVCLLDKSNSTERINLGRANRGPYIDESGRLKVNYTSGDPCHSNSAKGARFKQTLIEFTCDPHAIVSEPQFIGIDDCTYYFDWATVYACPPAKPTQKTDDCTVEDPRTGYLYNLTLFKDHGIFESKINGYRYHFSICGSDEPSGPCGADSGICQEELSGGERHFSGGKQSSNLSLRGGRLFLNYSGGDACHGGLFHRSSVIEFKCEVGAGMGEPEFLSESSDCSYFFEWKTSYVCQTAVHCAIHNGSESFDLTPLAGHYHTAGSYVNDGALYYISVCGPLPRIPNNYCLPNAGVCRLTKNSGDTTLWETLGKVEHAPFIDFMDHPTAIYTNGAPCSKNPGTFNKARIIFICDSNASLGVPVLIEILDDDCFYLFEWRTALVCPKAPVMDYNYCKYTDSSRGIHIDLSPLQQESHLITEDNTKYHVRVCSALNITNCEKAGVCAENGSGFDSYGLVSTQAFSYSGNRLRLQLSDGDDCPSGYKTKRSSEIFFICDPSAGIGKPVLHKKYTCSLLFHWKTEFVCQNNLQTCDFDIGYKHYDFNLLTSLSHNWNTSDLHANTYYINMCRGIQSFPSVSGCSNEAAVCMKTRDGNYMTLGTVDSMEYKQINSSDLMLTFTSLDTRACDHLPGAPLTPTTRVFMRCGFSLGNPKIFSGPDSQCFYDFVWVSSLACAEKAEIVMLEKDGIIRDEEFFMDLNITSILNKTFNVSGASGADEYLYEINLSGVYSNSTNPDQPCPHAAVCQTKRNSDFFRDIGSIGSRTFIIRRSELHLEFVSLTKGCGKNKSKNVTTIITMQCSLSTGIGSPKFLYESGNCDYIFEWETSAMCPDLHRIANDDGPKLNPIPDAFKEGASSSHKTEIIVGVLFAGIILMIFVFIIIKPERRALVSHRIRGLFGPVNLPYFRYRRSQGERLVLVDASQPNIFDENDVEMLT